MEVASFVQTVQNRQDVVISAPEEIAYQEKWIDKENLLESANEYGKFPYGEHQRHVAEDKTIFTEEKEVRQLSLPAALVLLVVTLCSTC